MCEDDVLVRLEEVSDVREGEPAHLDKAEEHPGAKHAVAQWFFSGCNCMCQSVAIRPGMGSKISRAFLELGVSSSRTLMPVAWRVILGWLLDVADVACYFCWHGRGLRTVRDERGGTEEDDDSGILVNGLK